MDVLVTDDSATNIAVLARLLSSIPNCTMVPFTDPVEALRHAQGNALDLILVDYMMPTMDGISFINRIRALPAYEDVPIVMITSRESARYAALDAGATDFLIKPFDPAEVRSRITNMLKLRDAQNRLRERAAWLADEVAKATASLAAREEEIILRLSRAAEFRDGDTGRHILRMAKYCRSIAEGLGLGREVCETLYLAAPMHDIGKIAVSDTILLKPGKLSPEERALMEQHTTSGYKILADSGCALLQMAAEVAWSHHERWDGGGYPRGLRGTEIPLFARVAAVADVFDALTSRRPYKHAWSAEEARVHIVENSGKQFDPDCVAAFLRRWDDIVAIHGERHDKSKAVA
jgi:putative two-component system response regulator